MPTVTASSSVEDAVVRRRGDLLELSHSIHAEPELAFCEHRSAAKTRALVAERGFEITDAPGGLATAFRASYGSGPLVVGVCAEYDALPEIGHACGHNIIAAAAVGAALALAEVADELGLTVVLLGTPAEESGGGKVLLLKAGAFDGIAATVMMHPGPLDIAAARSLALSEVLVRYHGRESHAAVAPYLGINAGDAVTVAQVAIGLLRQQLAPGQMVHGIVTDGGQCAQRDPGARRDALHHARHRIGERCGALEDRVGRLLPGRRPGDGLRLRGHRDRAVVPGIDPRRLAGRRVPRRDAAAGPHSRCRPSSRRSLPLGSTDMGNVTQVMPGIHPIVGLDAGGASVHQPAFAAAAAGPSGDAAVVEGGDHAGAHRGPAGGDARRTGPGARAGRTEEPAA